VSKSASLIGGTVEASEVLPDSTDKTVTKVMKTRTITRTPGGRIARLDLQTLKGFIELEIDEPTARAIVKVFDDAPAPWENP